MDIMLQITGYSLRLLFQYANEMREAQVEFFRTKQNVWLKKAIQAEKRFDRLRLSLWPLLADWDGSLCGVQVSVEEYEAMMVGE